MSHIRVERLAAGDRQRDSAQYDKADRRMGSEKAHGMDGADRREDLRESTDLDQSQDAQHSEPQHHNGTEVLADAFSATLLHDEEPEQHQQGHRQDEGL